jgi:hypothetical protein
LVIYDGWENLKLLGVIAVIAGPVLAMFLAHVFSASIAQQVNLQRTPTNGERIRIAANDSWVMPVADRPRLDADVGEAAGTMRRGPRVLA